jgi:hypothetical protein
LSVVATGGLTGGADAIGVGSVKQIIEYEQIGAANTARDLFAASVHGVTPALVLAWEGSGVPHKSGRGRHRRSDRWSLFVVTARGEGAHERRAEGIDILDAIESYLLDLNSAGGYPISDPPIAMLDRRRLSVTSSSYVFVQSFETRTAVVKIERAIDLSAPGAPAKSSLFGDEGLTFSEWLQTRFDLATATVPPFPIVEGVIDAMPLDGFADGFDDGFA